MATVGVPQLPKKNFFDSNCAFSHRFPRSESAIRISASVEKDDRKTNHYRNYRNVIPSTCYARGRPRPRATKVSNEISANKQRSGNRRLRTSDSESTCTWEVAAEPGSRRLRGQPRVSQRAGLCSPAAVLPGLSRQFGESESAQVARCRTFVRVKMAL